MSLQEIELFLDVLRDNEYTKVRDLAKLLKHYLDGIKINTILKYLERSRQIEIDFEGNIIWIKKANEQITFAEKAKIDKKFLDHINNKKSS